MCNLVLRFLLSAISRICLIIEFLYALSLLVNSIAPGNIVPIDISGEIKRRKPHRWLKRSASPTARATRRDRAAIRSYLTRDRSIGVAICSDVISNTFRQRNRRKLVLNGARMYSHRSRHHIHHVLLARFAQLHSWDIAG